MMEPAERITLVLGHVTRSVMTATRTLLGMAIPSEINAVADAVENSRSMLDWPDNWDGEGSPAYSETTWYRAGIFLLGTAIRLWHDYVVQIATPAVYNGPQGSIDVYWELADRKLLINVPQNPEEPISFYGHVSNSSNEMKGSLRDSDSKLWLMLMMWLMN